MPNLPDRDARAAQLAAALHRLGKRQLARIKAAMGNPPDVLRIPPGLWAEIEAEQRDAAKPLLAAVFVGVATMLGRYFRTQAGHEQDEPAVAIVADLWAEARAAELASGFTQHSLERIEAIDVAARTGEITARQAGDRLDTVFSPERFRVIGKNETTIATTQGGNGAIDEYAANGDGQLVPLLIWRHRKPIESGTHPCPLCLPLVNTDNTEWAAIDPEAAEGPPRHIGCDCDYETLLIPPEEYLARTGLQPQPRGGPQSYVDAFRRLKASR